MKLIKLNKKNKTIFLLCLFLSTMILSGIMGQFTVINDSSTNLTEDDGFNDEFSNNNIPLLSAYSNYEWWNDTWEYRIPVNVSANGAVQNNAPVELLVNFTQFFLNGSVINPELNASTIRVVEYASITDYTVIPCQFDPWSDFNKYINAIGDVIWIMNGTTAASATRTYFIYFENGTDPAILDPGYDIIRVWHEGFEHDVTLQPFQPGGQDFTDPWGEDDNITIVARGFRSLRIYGNNWKRQILSTPIPRTSNLRMTAKIRCEDIGILSAALTEITGVGPSRTNSWPSPGYNVHGNQIWDNSTYRDIYPIDQWNHYTFFIGTDSTSTPIEEIMYFHDDDSPSPDGNGENNYWDDISIWAKPVLTVPDHIIQTSIGEIEPVSYSLKITCADIDGFRIPNAHVYISNSSKSYLDQDDLTNSDGDVLFVNVSRTDMYDIIVNFTMQGVSVPLTETVATLDNYKPLDLHSEIIITLELWTINFNITDIDGNPVKYGFITLENNTDIVGNATLNQNGETQIIWGNQSSYNYSVYFDYGAMSDEATYYEEHLKIFNGTISRLNANNPTYVQNFIAVSDPAVIRLDVGEDLLVTYEWIPSNYQRIYSYNLSFVNMTNYIKQLYIKDENDTIIESFEDLSGVYSYVNYSVQGNNTNLGKILVELLKAGAKNESPYNGTFYITYVKSTKLNIIANISTIHFNACDEYQGELENAIIEIYNATAGSDVSVANITVQEGGTARFIHFIYGDIYNQGNYSMKLWFAGSYRQINKTYYDFASPPGDPWTPPNEGLNFTLLSESWNTTVAHVNIQDWKTFISLTSAPLSNVYWRDNIVVKVIFQANISGTVTPTDADSIKFAVVDSELTELTEYTKLDREFTANYNLTFDTSILSAGNTYFVKIIGSKSGYLNPNPLIVIFALNEILTDMQIYNYSSGLEYDTNEITEYWGENLNITVKFYETSIPTNLIGEASVSYKWTFEPASVDIEQDPIKLDGYYTLFFNTSKAQTTGKYLIEFTAQKGNFSTTIKNFFINIIKRPTTVNHKAQIDRIYKEIYVEDPYNFTFTFRDNLTGEILTDLDSHYYLWERYDELGTVIDSGSGFLNETGAGDYTLDFNTENRTVGDYLLFVTLDKDNYDYATALISLSINLREITRDLVGVEGSQINSIQGDIITIKLKLTDPTRNNTNLTGAIVNLTIGDAIYTFTDDDGDGVYEYDFTTSEINAFIIAQTLTGKIKYWASNHINYTMDVTIVVGMPEIFPGMPLFYFILIMVIVIVGVGGIVGYRVVQQAKIPAFVKKTKSMSKAIKGGKSIPASIKAPTKQEYIIDSLKSLWDKLGLSIEDTLGIKGKKFEEIKKELPETEREYPEVEEEPPEPEKEYPEVKEEPPEPEKKYPEVEEEPPEPEREYPEPEKEPPEPEREPSELEREYPEVEEEPPEPEWEYPEVEEEPPEPEWEYPEVEEEPPEPEREPSEIEEEQPEIEKEYDENQEGGSEE